MKLIITDMDGTLLNDKKEIDNEFLEIVEKNYKNTYFVIASGRPYYTLKKQFKNHIDKLIFICDNGSFVMKDDKCLFSDTIDNDIIIDALNSIKENKTLFPILGIDKCAYIKDHDNNFLNHAREYYKNIVLLDDLDEISKHEKIGKVAIYDSVDSFTNAYEKVKHLKKLAQISVSAKDWVDINPLGTNKGTALEKLINILDISKEDCYGFGDYLNDLEMLKICGNSYAMLNATEEIKKISKYITKYSNNENGVTKTIKEILGI